ncbi:MAG TPA: hypothetical protein VFE47_14690, partial [Tepidisphaeraceae bacterium]|nr:hypothetical protein [Tepidisphaeraceae bacterium]
MSRFRFAGVAGAVVMLTLLASAQITQAAEKAPAELLPPSTVVCVEINQPKDLISFAFDSAVRKQIDQTEGYRKFIDNPQYKIFQIIVAAIEQRAGVKWRQALETTTDGGVVLAFDAQTQGLVLLAKPSDPKTTDAVRDAFFAIARDDATKKGNPDPIEQKDYRGLTAFKIGDGMIANIGPYLMLTNKPDLAKATADRFLDGGASLADDHTFSGAHHDAAASSTAWVFVRTAPLRAMATDNPLLDPKYKSDNPAAEFLLGGLLPVVQKAEYVTASLSVKPDDLKLTLAAPL